MQNDSMEMMDPAKLAEFGVWFVVFLFSLTLHEGAHALAARLGGDDTAYLGGQVTLNPIPHIRRELFGTIVVPVLSFFLAGWMMGWASTPYDPEWARRHPRAHAAMSAAGPAANLLIAVAAFILLRLLLSAGVLEEPAGDSWELGRLASPAASYGEGSLLHPLAMALSVALSLNVLLGLFNLLPLPPMDGSGVLQGLFPESFGRLVEMLQANPMMSILGLLLAWRVFHYIFGPAMRLVIGLLFG